MFGKIGVQNAMSKRVIELTTNKIYESANLASKDLQLSFSHVCSVARGERGSTGGYVFRYLDKNNQIIQPTPCASIKFKKVKDKILPQYKSYIE